MTQTAEDTKTTDKSQSNDNENGGGGKNPVVERLLNEAQSYVFNRATHLVGNLGDKVTGTIDKIDGINGDAVKSGVKSMAGGDSPVTAGLKSGGTAIKDKVKGLFGGGSKGRGNQSLKATNINESIDIGLPVSTVYNQWTQFEEFGSFMKGVQSVEQKDETTTAWRAKVAFSKRSWESTIKEQVPDERIAWSSEGAKGTVDGVVTFHELAPNLTRVIVELEYSPKGLFEKTGNIWRAQGRRARLDLKHFRRFVMMRGEETGAWRGRIEDGEVTETDDSQEGSDEQRDEAQDEDRDQDQGQDQGQGQDKDKADDRAQDDDESQDEKPAARKRSNAKSKSDDDGKSTGDRKSEGGRRTRKEAASSGGRR